MDLSGAFSLIYNPATEKLVADWIAKNDNPNTIYHLHGWHSALSPSIFRALGRVASRLTIHAHDYFMLCPNGAFYNYQRNTICNLEPLSRRCLTTNCDKRAYHHKLWRVARQGLRQALMDLRKLPGRIILLHAGMAPYFETADLSRQCTIIKNPTLLKPAERVEAERNKALVFVGRLVPEKGAEDALAAARATGMPAIIVGDGPERERLQAEYPEAEFTGWIDHQSVAAVMRRARLLAMPSRYPEPYGMVCIEAAGVGVPVVVPQTALLASDIAALDFGYVCDTSSVEAFSNVLAAASADDATIMEKSQRAYAAAPTLCLSPQAWADALLQVYGELLDGADVATGRATA